MFSIEQQKEIIQRRHQIVLDYCKKKGKVYMSHSECSENIYEKQTTQTNNKKFVQIN